MFKDLSMRIFLVHVTAFVTGVIICAAINLWLTPGTLWFPWVLMGWGVAVATHALALTQDAPARAHLHRSESARLNRPSLRLCGGGAAASLRQSHGNTE